MVDEWKEGRSDVEQPNPYESPQIPEERPFDDQRTIVLRFVVDRAWRRKSADTFRGWRAVVRAVTLPSLFVIGLVAALAATKLLGAFFPEHYIAHTIAFLVAVLLAVAAQLLIDWLLMAPERRALQRHPILGANGEWLLSMDTEQVNIQTSRGKQAWPLAEVGYQVNTANTVILWLESGLPVAMPYAANCQEWQSRQTDVVFRSRVKVLGMFR